MQVVWTKGHLYHESFVSFILLTPWFYTPQPDNWCFWTNHKCFQGSCQPIGNRAKLGAHFLLTNPDPPRAAGHRVSLSWSTALTSLPDSGSSFSPSEICVFNFGEMKSTRKVRGNDRNVTTGTHSFLFSIETSKDSSGQK